MHLTGPILLKHIKNFNFDIRERRNEQSAKLHSVSTNSPINVVEQATGRNLTGGDFWAERGEHGRWVRVHVKPRSSMFYPEEAPRGPGRKTRLKPLRKVQGTFVSGLRFNKENDWTMDNIEDELNENCTGKTIFNVDKHYSPDHGTDQRQ